MAETAKRRRRKKGPAEPRGLEAAKLAVKADQLAQAGGPVEE